MRPRERRAASPTIRPDSGHGRSATGGEPSERTWRARRMRCSNRRNPRSPILPRICARGGRGRWPGEEPAERRARGRRVWAAGRPAGRTCADRLGRGATGRGSWRDPSEILPGSWRDPGRKLAGSWREAGGKLVGSWRDGSRTVRERFEDVGAAEGRSGQAGDPGDGAEPAEGRARPEGTLAGSWRDGSRTVRERFENDSRTSGRRKRRQAKPARPAAPTSL